MVPRDVMRCDDDDDDDHNRLVGHHKSEFSLSAFAVVAWIRGHQVNWWRYNLLDHQP